MKIKNSKSLVKLISKVTYYLIVLMMINPLLAKNTNGQTLKDTKVNLALDNATVIEVFHNIEEQTPFRFIYDQKVSNTDNRISLRHNGISLYSVLQILSKEARIKFRQVNRSISVAPIPEKEKIIPVPVSIEISGKVTDSEGHFLPATSIFEKGTNNGTISDFDGNYRITVSSSDAVLVFSYIGYETKEIQVNNQTVINVALNQEAGALDEVVVQSSRRLSEAKALNIQKNSVNIKNVIAADGIGKLPDRNAAEAVQRIPGVSIERDQAEGRFVAVRGLPSEWNSTTINGNRIPTAEEETTNRAVAFDFFPSEMIGYVEVSKALTPDQDGDAIGGSVNFITKSAPSKFTLDATLGTGYNQKAEKGVYSGSFTFGNKSEDGKIGYIFNVSQWNRNWATDNFEARRKGDEGVFRLELRDYTGLRKTTGINGAIEFNPSEKSKFYTKINYGTLVDEETHYKHRIRFDKYKGIGDPSDQTGRVELQNIRDDLITEFVSAEVGGKHYTNNGVVDWSLATYRNEFKYGNIPNNIDNSYYVVKFKQDNVGFNPAYLEDRGVGPRVYWNSDQGNFNANNVGNLFGFFSNSGFRTDPSLMSFSDLELYKVSVIERDNIVATFNYEFDASDVLTLKFGGKLRDKDRIANFVDEFYAWSGSGDAPTLSDYAQFNIDQPGRTGFLSDINAPISNSFGSVLSEQGMVQFYNDHFRSNLGLLAGDSAIPSQGGGLGRNFDVDETHASGYAMATYKASDKVTILGGLRATNTWTRVKGAQFEVTEQTPNGNVVPVTQTKTTLHCYPCYTLSMPLTKMQTCVLPLPGHLQDLILDL